MGFEFREEATGKVMMKIDRRVFLELAGCACLQSVLPKAVEAAVCREEMSLDGVAFPEWAVREIDDGLQRFARWKGDDQVISFTIVTDTHSHFLDLERPANWRDPRNHYLFLRKIAELAGSAAVLNLGDLDFDLGRASPTEEEIHKARDGFLKVLSSEMRPQIFTKGNHDSARGRMSSGEFGATFNVGLNRAKGHDLHLSKCGTWGYYDVPGGSVRVIFLNSSDEGYQGFSREQLQFLADCLAATPDGCGVLVVQHTNMPEFIVRWRRTLADARETKRSVLEMQIIEDFANRRGGIVEGWKNDAVAGCYDGVKWDFRAAKGRLIGVLQGHAHSESYLKYANVNYIIRPGYGTIPVDCRCGEWRDPKRNEQGARIFSCDKSMMIDLLAVKPSRRIAHIFRFGTGGEQSELDFAY